MERVRGVDALYQVLAQHVDAVSEMDIDLLAERVAIVVGHGATAADQVVMSLVDRLRAGDSACVPDP